LPPQSCFRQRYFSRVYPLALLSDTACVEWIKFIESECRLSRVTPDAVVRQLQAYSNEQFSRNQSLAFVMSVYTELLHVDEELLREVLDDCLREASMAPSLHIQAVEERGPFAEVARQLSVCALI